MTGAWRIFVAVGLGFLVACVSGCREPEETPGPPEVRGYTVQPAQEPAGPNIEEGKAGEAKETATGDRTPLHIAASKGDLAAVKDLLAHGADPNVRMADGSAPLHFAALNGNKEIAEALCRAGATVDARDNEGLTPLALAQNAAVARCLIERGADVNIRSVSGQPLLERAVVRGDKDMCEALLDGGADLGVVETTTGMTLLQAAAQMGRAEIAELLVDRGADPNAMDGYGKAPLHIAAYPGYESVVRVLLAKGADVNLLGEYGTPLHEAAMNGKVEMVRVLLAHGADPEIKNVDGSTPLDMAISLGHEEVVRILRSAMEANKRRPAPT